MIVLSRVRWDGSIRRILRRAAVLLVATCGLLSVALVGATPSSAAGPTITVSPTSAGPQSYVQVGGSGWTANKAVYIYVDGSGLCSVTTTASGAIPTTACFVPGIPVGAQTVVAEYVSNTPIATTTLTIVPRVTYLPNPGYSPGTSFVLDASGFVASSQISVYLDSTSSTALTTNPATPVTDASGNMNSLGITIPASAAAGAHTLILSDGSANKAKKAMSIYSPTDTISPTSAPYGTAFAFSGSGWRPNDGVYALVGGSNICSITTDSKGSFSTVCNAPGIPAGAHTVVAEQDGNYITAAPSTYTEEPGVSYFPTPAVTAGASIRADTGGLAASSAVSAYIGSTKLVTVPASPVSDANGNMSDLTVTIPKTAAVGAATLTIKDAAGNSATAALAVYKPKVTLGATSGSPGGYVTVTGKGLWPNQTVYFYVGTTNFCALNANSSGVLNSYCPTPTAPAGAQTLSVQQDSGAITKNIKAKFTIVPAITYFPYSNATGGATLPLNAYGLAANAPVTFTLSGTSGNLVTTPVSPVTDANGTVTGVSVTLPASPTAGAHTLTISDGTNTATQAVNILAPTFSVSENSDAPGGSFAFSGSGFNPNDGVSLYFGTNDECSGSADASGDVVGYCNIPSLPPATYPLTVQQDGGIIDVSAGSFTIT